MFPDGRFRTRRRKEGCGQTKVTIDFTQSLAVGLTRTEKIPRVTVTWKEKGYRC